MRKAVMSSSLFLICAGGLMAQSVSDLPFPRPGDPYPPAAKSDLPFPRPGDPYPPFMKSDLPFPRPGDPYPPFAL